MDVTTDVRQETFECCYCKEAELDREDCIHPMDELEGFDEATGKPVCMYCADDAEVVDGTE